MLNRVDEAQDGLHARCQAILAQADGEGRPLTAEEQAEVDSNCAEFERLDGQRATLQKFEAATERGPGRRTDAGEIGGDGFGGARDRGDPSRWGAAGYQFRADSPFKAMFGAPGREMHGFKDAREFFAAVLSGRHDSRLLAAGQRTDEGEHGGFFMPAPIVAGLLDSVVATSTILSRVRRVPVSAKNTAFPLWREADRSAGLLAGFAVEWLAEGAPGTLQTGRATQLSVTTNKLGIYSKATAELLEDSPLFSTEFQPALERAAAYGFDRALARGTGVGQPLGILNDPAAITVAKETGQAADTVTYGNAVAMYAALYPAGASRSVWLAHPTVLPSLLKMSRYVQNVAGTENVGGEAVVAMSDSGEMRLLGRPVVFTEHLNPLGDLGDIVLCDPTQYAAFLRSQVRVETSRDAYWQSDEVGFRLIWRATGQGLWETPGTRPGDVAPSESWAVKLATRS